MRNVCSLTNGKDLFPAVDDERSWCREKRNIEKALCPADENDKKEKEPEGRKRDTYKRRREEMGLNVIPIFSLYVGWFCNF